MLYKRFSIYPFNDKGFPWRQKSSFYVAKALDAYGYIIKNGIKTRKIVLNKDVFSKVGAFSPATWLWSNWFYGAVTNSGCNYKYTMPDGAERDYVVAVDGIKRLFVYQGGNDGSAGDANWALHDVENIYSLMKAKGAGSEASRYI